MEEKRGYSGLELLAALRGVLCYHRELGIEPWPRGEALEAFLGLPPRLPEIAAEMPRRVEPRRQPPPAAGEAAPAALSAELAEITRAVAGCSACELHSGAAVRPSGRRIGRDDGVVRLMIVGTWPATGEGVFGAAEDAMLEKMIEAIGLPAEQVYVTNAIKCCPAAGVHPAPRHALSCVRHLSAEIAAVKPQFLCLMGAVAVRSLLGSRYKVPQMRGRFFSVSAANEAVPALVTWHPSTLLAEKRLKRAAWDDLQLLAKKMGLDPKR